jgi:hypothetical protein
MTRKFSIHAVVIASAIGLALSMVALTPIHPEPVGAQTNEVVTKEFKFVSHAEYLTLPAGVSRITIVAAGGKGGKGAYNSGNGGAGIQVTAKDIQVGAERDVQVLVGGNGEHGGISKDRGGTGGFNGGGDANDSGSGGGGGGGFTQVVSSPSGKVLVMAAGGGGGGGGVSGAGHGGPNGATLDGTSGSGITSDAGGGGGGTLNAGGAGGHNKNPLIPDGKGGGRYGGGKGGPGVLPQFRAGGGGGGGGYFGGGGAAGTDKSGGGGGAGSSYVTPDVRTVATPAPGEPGVKISYEVGPPPPPGPALECVPHSTAKVGDTLKDFHICTSDGRPLPVVSVEGQLPPETTWKRWPTNNDTWIVLNGKLTTAAEWAPVFIAQAGGTTYRIQTTFLVNPRSEPPASAPGSPSTPSTPAPPTAKKPAPTPPAPASVRCDATVQNLTGMGDVDVTTAAKDKGDRWDPELVLGQKIPDSQSINWASVDPRPGGCRTEARLELPRPGGAPVVWDLSVKLTGKRPEVTCTASDNAFPCTITPDPSVADGVLTAKVKLRHE